MKVARLNSESKKLRRAITASPSRLFSLLPISVAMLITQLPRLGSQFARAAEEPAAPPASVARAVSGQQLSELSEAADRGDAAAQLALGNFYAGPPDGPPDMVEAAKWYLKAAEAGNAEAQLQLAICLMDGNGVNQDAEQAVRWAEKAKSQGNKAACLMYARWLLRGEGVDPSPMEAALLLSELAQQGVAGAKYELGFCYMHGKGVAKDAEQAFRLFADAAEDGLAEAKVLAGWHLIKGIGVPTNQREGIRLVRQAAEDSNVLGQRILARCLQDGTATERDDVEAAKWAKKAADAGDAESQCRYGVLLMQQSEDTTKKYIQAFEYFYRAAQQGNAWGQRLVGIACMRGRGVQRDPKEGCNWLKLSADQGDAYAQWTLGDVYADGDGVEKNPTEALRWLVKAAETGNSTVQAILGNRLLYGRGVPTDVKHGREWLLRSANQGDAEGQEQVALMYANGIGVPKNTKLSYYWVCLALSQEDNAGRRRFLRDLETRMSLQDVADAQRLAAQFVPQLELGAGEENDAPEVTHIRPRSGSGSGFFITKNGFFVTNCHVVENAKHIRIKTPQGTFDASVLRSDPANDLAILKVNGDFEALHVRGSRGLRVADTVFTVGYPTPDLQGLAAKYSSGEVSALSGLGDDARRIQVSVPIQPGNSGGPLLDSSGSVVGVVDSQLNKAAVIAERGVIPENVNFAIKGTILLGIIEAVPEIAGNLLPEPKDPPNGTPADIVARVEPATGIVFVSK